MPSAAANLQWTQSPKELYLNLPIDAGVKAKEIDVRLTTQQIAVHVRGVELLNGQTFLPIRPDDSTWEIEAETRDCARRLRLVVSKVRPNQKWDCLFMHEVDESITHRVFMDITIGGSPAGRYAFVTHAPARLELRSPRMVCGIEASADCTH
uniref:CS domain-containing protein n=1 Tax=Chrysotila carterae TaxID=13221 RepID=A0A7S4F4T6_CHRCT